MTRIRTTLTSDTPHLPELAPLVGRRVRITVEGEPAEGEPGTPAVIPGTGDWAAAERTARAPRHSGYDWNAWREQRDFDQKHAGEDAS